jgi:hypothetical protein
MIEKAEGWGYTVVILMKTVSKLNTMSKGI